MVLSLTLKPPLSALMMSRPGRFDQEVDLRWIISFVSFSISCFQEIPDTASISYEVVVFKFACLFIFVALEWCSFSILLVFVFNDISSQIVIIHLPLVHSFFEYSIPDSCFCISSV